MNVIMYAMANAKVKATLNEIVSTMVKVMVNENGESDNECIGKDVCNDE